MSSRRQTANLNPPRLKPAERAILSSRLQVLIRQNSDSWSQLKREIFDQGFQVQYESTLDFFAPVERMLAALPQAELAALAHQWQERHPDASSPTTKHLQDEYALVLLEELVARARIASNKTSEW